MDGRRTALLASLLLLAVPGACSSGEAGGPDAAPGDARAAGPGAAEVTAEAEALQAGPNLLLVTLDTLRADRIGAYGYEAIDTPTLDRLAAEGVRFDQVASPVPITLPAHSSILTGRYPPAHGVRNNGTYRLEDDAMTLAEVLRGHGYATGGFVGSFVLDRRFGIAQGFDAYTDFRRQEADVGAGSLLDLQRPAGAVVDEALEWLGDRQGPFFAWVHLYDPHTPYEAPEPFAGSYPGRPYDAEIAYTDSEVGRLLDELAALGHGDDTLVVVAADHGEGLGDHGEDWHTFFIYDSTVRAPLILWAPTGLPGGVVVEGQASLVDIVPTSLALLGVADPAAGERQGADLRGAILSPAAEGRPAYSESFVPLLSFGWSELRAVRHRGFKYVAAPRPELYDLTADPGELDNVVADHPDRVAELTAALAALVGEEDPEAVAGGQQVADAETLDRLRSLGYIASGSSGPIDRSVDPKDRIEVFEAFNDGLERVVEAVAAEEWSRAEGELHELDALAPDHFLVQHYLGRVALAQGDAGLAIQYLERSLELNASYTLTFVELARAYRRSGQADRAIELLVEARRADPESFSFPFHLGYQYQAAGRLDAALRAYEEAREMLPRHPQLLSNLASLHLMRNEPHEALEVLGTLVEERPDDGRAWANMGMVLGGMERFAEAEEAFRTAIEHEPGDALMHFNLGLALVRQGKRQAAVTAFRRALELDPGLEAARRALDQLGGDGAG